MCNVSRRHKRARTGAEARVVCGLDPAPKGRSSLLLHSFVSFPQPVHSPPQRLAILVEMTRDVSTHSAEETIAFGRTLVELLAPPKLVLLGGDLGAGKTTLVKGIAAGFEAAEEEDVTSPTFTLVHEYRGPRANLYHIDLYRVDTQRELETLALDDLRGEDSILLIEWGEKFPRLLRERDVEISLERESENGRKIRIVS
jgi:tRNA threonylcarbamoyladenosine biosynthesis protein TsaE